MQEPQSNSQEKNNPSILKDDFSSKTNPPPFTSIAIELLDWSNKTNCIFSELRSTSHFLPQSAMSCKPDSSSEASSSCCHKSNACSHLE